MSLRGNIPVIPTPFLNGKVHYEDFDRLIERTVESLDGYVVCGSTGEAPALSKEERIQIVDYLAKRVPTGKEIVVGLGHTNVREAVEIGKAASDSGVSAALVPSPYYFPNTLEMVEEYVGMLADKTGLDIVFYDNSVTTSTGFTADELLHMAKSIPSIKAVKMTDHAFAKIRKLKEQCRNDSAFISMFGPGDEIPTTKALFHHLAIFSSPETRLPLLPSDSKRIQEVILGYETGMKQKSSNLRIQ